MLDRLPERRPHSPILVSPVVSLNSADFEIIRENMGGIITNIEGGGFVLKFPQGDKPIRDCSRLIKEDGELYIFDYGGRSMLSNTSVAISQKGTLAFVEATRTKKEDGSYVESTYVILVDENGETRHLYPATEEKDKNIKRARALSRRLQKEINK